MHYLNRRVSLLMLRLKTVKKNKSFYSGNKVDQNQEKMNKNLSNLQVLKIIISILNQLLLIQKVPLNYMWYLNNKIHMNKPKEVNYLGNNFQNKIYQLPLKVYQELKRIYIRWEIMKLHKFWKKRDNFSILIILNR